MRLYQQYTSWDNPKDPERSLVIGYVSPDYFTHSVSYFIEAPLAYHDYANFKVVVYSAVVKVLFILNISHCLYVIPVFPCMMYLHVLLQISSISSISCSFQFVLHLEAYKSLQQVFLKQNKKYVFWIYFQL